jgi:hypothetical protein
MESWHGNSLSNYSCIHLETNHFGLFENFTGGDKNRKFQVSDVLLHSCSIITASLKIIPQYNVNFVRRLKHSRWLSFQSFVCKKVVLFYSLCFVPLC